MGLCRQIGPSAIFPRAAHFIPRAPTAWAPGSASPLRRLWIFSPFADLRALPSVAHRALHKQTLRLWRTVAGVPAIGTDSSLFTR
jgi:hypothetical protein